MTSGVHAVLNLSLEDECNALIQRGPQNISRACSLLNPQSPHSLMKQASSQMAEQLKISQNKQSANINRFRNSQQKTTTVLSDIEQKIRSEKSSTQRGLTELYSAEKLRERMGSVNAVAGTINLTGEIIGTIVGTAASSTYNFFQSTTAKVCSLDPKLQQGCNTADAFLRKGTSTVIETVKDVGKLGYQDLCVKNPVTAPVCKKAINLGETISSVAKDISRQHRQLRDQGFYQSVKHLGVSEEESTKYVDSVTTVGGTIACTLIPINRIRNLFGKLTKALKNTSTTPASPKIVQTLKTETPHFTRKTIQFADGSGFVSVIYHKPNSNDLCVLVHNIQRTSSSRNTLFHTKRILLELAEQEKANTLFIQATNIKKRLFNVLSHKFSFGMQYLYIPKPPQDWIYPVFRINMKSAPKTPLIKGEISSAYYRTMGSDQVFVEGLRKQIKEISKPKGFPEHFNQFLNQCSEHTFNLKKVGPSGKGYFNGKILYQEFEDSALFLIKRKISSHILREKIGVTELWKSQNLNAYERMGLLLKEIDKVSQEKGYKKIYLAWDSNKMPLGKMMAENGAVFDAAGFFSQGVNATPLSLIEVATALK